MHLQILDAQDLVGGRRAAARSVDIGEARLEMTRAAASQRRALAAADVGIADAQRGAKAQPGGSAARSGGWPSIGTRRRPVPPSRRGTEASRPRV